MLYAHRYTMPSIQIAIQNKFHQMLRKEAIEQGLFMTKYKPSIVQLFFSQQSTKDLVNSDGDFCLQGYAVDQPSHYI